MTTITKEFAQDIIKGHGYGVAPSAVEALARIALASLETTPIYQVKYGNDWRDVERGQYDDHAGHGSPIRVVYSAPPVPVAQKNMLAAPPVLRRAPYWTGANSAEPKQCYIAGWNACRAAMLKAADHTNLADHSGDTTEKVELVSESRNTPVPQQEAK